METLLGLLGMVAFIAGVLAVAAAVTWTVVKLTPPARRREGDEQPTSSS